MPRAGKSRERRLAELMTGPVVVPEPLESADASKPRSLAFDGIMKLETPAQEEAASTTKTIAELPSVVRMFAASLGGFRTADQIVPERRGAALEVFRKEARGGGTTPAQLRSAVMASATEGLSSAGQQHVQRLASAVPRGGKELKPGDVGDARVFVAQREASAAAAAATAQSGAALPACWRENEKRQKVGVVSACFYAGGSVPGRKGDERVARLEVAKE